MSVVSTLAEIFTDVHQKLGAPARSPSIQIKRAVHEACAIYWTELIQSDQNQVIKTTALIPFVDNQYIYSLADITDMAMPDWVEVQIGPNDSDWVLVSVVNRDSLSLFRDRSELACSIYSRLESNVLVNSIEFSYNPWTIGSENNNFRIWYDPTITVNTTDGDATGFPHEYNYLIAVEAVIKLVPIMIQVDVALAKEEKTEQFILNAQMKAWEMLLQQTLDERVEWRKKWRNYCLGSRLNQGGRKKRFYQNGYY
jgi:hypothetical protein